MRYFFDAAGKCLSIITENPTNNIVPAAAAAAVHVVDGDYARGVNQVYMSTTYAVINGLSCTFSASQGSSLGNININASMSAWPISGSITVYIRGNTSGSIVSSARTANGSFNITVNGSYQEYVTIWATMNGITSNSGSGQTCNCDCNCDCGG